MTAPILYHFREIDGALDGSSVARESPREPGDYLVPAYATLIAPPEEVPERSCPVFDAGTNAWSIVPDHRGVPLWSTETAQSARIDVVGVTPDEVGLTELAPPPGPVRWVDGTWEIQVNKVIGAAWESIKAERDRRMANGGYQVGTKWFHSDQASRVQQLALARKADRIEVAGGDLGATMERDGKPLYWKTMDGTFVPMTGLLAQQIADAAEAGDLALFTAAETHRQAMAASQDPAAYDYSGGWPATFEEAQQQPA